MGFAKQLTLGLVPALVTSVFAYFAAIHTAKGTAEAKANDRADVALKVTDQAVGKVVDAVESNQSHITDIQAHLKQIESRLPPATTDEAAAPPPAPLRPVQPLPKVQVPENYQAARKAIEQK